MAFAPTRSDDAAHTMAARTSTTQHAATAAGGSANKHGSYALTDEEARVAFSYLDVQAAGCLTAANLRARLGPILFPGASPCSPHDARDAVVRTLLGDKEWITFEELKALLLAAQAQPAASSSNGSKHKSSIPRASASPTPSAPTDPVADAFALLDYEGSGCITRERVRQILLDVDFCQATEEELATLLHAIDADHDGRIGLEDFCRLLRGLRTDMATTAAAAEGSK